LLHPQDVTAALEEMRRVLRSGELLIVSTRPYDEILKTRPTASHPVFRVVVPGHGLVDGMKRAHADSLQGWWMR
jgi:glycine/sarcosine N-methyltransferase